jgi:hypothetical protein
MQITARKIMEFILHTTFFSKWSFFFFVVVVGKLVAAIMYA